jgi:hypothetical protein
MWHNAVIYSTLFFNREKQYIKFEKNIIIITPISKKFVISADIKIIELFLTKIKKLEARSGVCGITLKIVVRGSNL